MPPAPRLKIRRGQVQRRDRPKRTRRKPHRKPVVQSTVGTGYIAVPVDIDRTDNERFRSAPVRIGVGTGAKRANAVGYTGAVAETGHNRAGPGTLDALPAASISGILEFVIGSVINGVPLNLMAVRTVRNENTGISRQNRRRGKLFLSV